MTLELHDYQNRAVDLTVKYGAIYHMLDAGLGKTAIALKVIERLGIPAFILGPKLAVTYTWPNEIAKWTPRLRYTVLHGNNKNYYARQAAGCDVTLLNYEGLKWFMDTCNKGGFKLRKFLVVFDESSMIKYRTKETKTGMLPRFEMLAQMMPIYSGYRLALSATPVPNSLIELWAQYYLLDKGKRLTPSYYDFRGRYFNYTGAPLFQTNILPGSEEKIYSKIADITFQLNAEDHLNMPPLQQNTIRIPMPKSIRKLYDKMDTEYIVEFKDGDVVVANSQATAGLKLRQLLQGGIYTDNGQRLLKSPAKAQYLQAMLQQSAGQSILCAIQFQFEYEVICNLLKRQVPIIAGRTSSTDAAKLLRQWDQGKLPLLLVHPGSVQYSLNMQAGGHILLWLALPWSYEQYYQLIRRLYRQGQTRGVMSHAVCFENSIDEDVAWRLKQKFETDVALKQAMRERGLQL